MQFTHACLASSAVALLGLAAASAEAATLNSLASFSGTSNGSKPRAGMIVGPGGLLYGTTQSGGANGSGTIFSFNPGTHALTRLASFTGANTGSAPYSGLVADSFGNLYGTTVTGGANGVGAVYKFDTTNNQITRLASFNSANGLYPYAGLAIDASGNLYGTETQGSSGGYGSIFKLDASNNYALSTLGNFNGSGQNGVGNYPEGGVIIGSDGNLYGTASHGGLGGMGTIYRYNMQSDTVSRLASFNGVGNGHSPRTTLLADADGDLYGTTYRGGANDKGTVFSFDIQTNTLTTLATFNDANGANPYGELIADAEGSLYGTTFAGGANGKGTVFKLDASNNYELVTLASFNTTNGANPYGGLVADAAGNLYGTTWAGGTSGNGTIFMISDSGFTVPEPSALALAGLAGLALLRRQRA